MDLAERTLNTPNEEVVPSTPIVLGYFESRLKSEYPFMENEHIIRTVNRAKAIYYSAKFPCEPNVDETTRPITSFVAKEQVIMICTELCERLGINSIVGYRENGVSTNYEGAWVSSRLLSLITPVIGVL